MQEDQRHQESRLSGGSISDESVTVLGGNLSQIAYKKAQAKKWKLAKVNGRPNVIWNIRKCDGKYYATVHASSQLLSSADGLEWSAVKLLHHEDNEEAYQMVVKGIACAAID